MLARFIHNKQSVPHVSNTKLDHSPMLVEALFQMVAFIHKISKHSYDRLLCQTFYASRELHELEFGNSWYNGMVS